MYKMVLGASLIVLLFTFYCKHKLILIYIYLLIYLFDIKIFSKILNPKLNIHFFMILDKRCYCSYLMFTHVIEHEPNNLRS